MATQETARHEPTTQATADQAGHAAPGKLAALLPKITMLAVVLAVMTVECLAAYLYIPSADELATAAGASMAAESPPAPVVEEATPKPALNEVDMGEYRIMAVQPLTNTNLRIDFKLYGMVTEADQVEFVDLFDKNKHRLRDQVITMVRGSDMTDLTDAGLGLIRRRILETTNHTLGKPLLHAVIFSDFSVVEQ